MTTQSNRSDILAWSYRPKPGTLDLEWGWCYNFISWHICTYLFTHINDWYKPYYYQDWLRLLRITLYCLPLSTSLLITSWLIDKNLFYMYINPRITAVVFSLNLGNLTSLDSTLSLLSNRSLSSSAHRTPEQASKRSYYARRTPISATTVGIGNTLW